MNKRIAITLIALSSLALDVSGAPIITEVTSQAAFNLAVTGETTTTENFESPAVTPNSYFTYSGTYSSLVGTFTNGNNIYHANGNNGGALGPGDGSTYLAWNDAYGTTLTLNAGNNAAGSDVFTPFGPSVTVDTATVTATNGVNTFNQTFTFDAPPATGSPSTAFEGFIAPTGYTITSIAYQFTGGQYAALDNYGVAASVPEPNTYALMGVGLAVLAGALRLRRLRTL